MDFRNVKKQVLSAKDLSKKGSVDSAVHCLVNYLNEHDNYVTTSSCSGRAILLSLSNVIPAKRAKKDCNWLFTTHTFFEAEDLIQVANPSNGDLLFKFEPFILHVMCADLEAANVLLKVAIGAGFRESGMTVGSHGKIMVAVRSNLRLEVPISDDSVMLVSDAYFMSLARFTNEKFETNFQKIKVFQTVLEETLEGKLNMKKVLNVGPICTETRRAEAKSEPVTVVTTYSEQ